MSVLVGIVCNNNHSKFISNDSNGCWFCKCWATDTAQAGVVFGANVGNDNRTNGFL